MSSNMNNRIHWATLCREWRDSWVEVIPEGLCINIYTFINALNATLPDACDVVTDAGSAFYSLSQNIKIRDGQRFVVSASQADMGCALPSSIGVATVNPNKTVIVVTGDGSFASNVQELATIRATGLPIKIFVLNNKGYLSIRNTQNKFFEGRVYGVGPDTGVWFPPLDKVAAAYEIEYVALDSENMISHMQKILSSPHAVLCEVMCAIEQEVIPTQALKEVDGKKVQAALDDMYPFMPEETLRRERQRALSPAPWEQPE